MQTGGGLLCRTALVASRADPGGACVVQHRSPPFPSPVGSRLFRTGKSTLVGCLTRRVADNGRGFARALVFRHKHELENGRTSSVATEVMGFKDKMQVPVDVKSSRAAVWQNVFTRADKSITLVDLCGHEKYLKTTVFGLTGMLPDYALVIVGANMGVSRMTTVSVGVVFFF